jgi:hypothetical protein
LFLNGSSNDTQVMPNFGMSAFSSNQGDSLSAYVIKWPAQLLGATVADPTSTSGWSNGGGTMSSVSASTSKALQRIWTDDGSTDFYGATKAMHFVATGSQALSSPFFNVTAGTAYTVAFALTLETAVTTGLNWFIDWYNASSTLLSSSSANGPFTTITSPVRVKGSATAPTGATKAKIRWQMGSAGTIDVAQLMAVAGTWNNLPWYSTAPSSAQLLFNVAAPAGVAPTGQTNATNGWPCFAMLDAPAAGDWFHVAVDSGKDNAAVPYSTTAGSRMPSLFVNGAAVRMWTSGKDPGVTFNAQPFASLGVRVYFAGGGGVPTPDTSYSLACSVDELYVADATIAAVGRVTSAKAAAHYAYGLARHDFVEQDTGARVTAVLDSLGWPSSLRDVDTGTVDVLAKLPDATSTGLALVQDANAAEGGLYFVAADGTFTFWAADHVLGSSAVITIGDTSGDDVHYEPGPVVTKDDTHIYNQVTLTQTVTDGSGDTPAVVQVIDATSQGQYNVRPLSISAPWASAADMATAAAAILADYKTPVTRVSNVSAEAVGSGAFASLLPRDLGDFITVNITPRSNGAAISIDAYLQGLTIAIGPQQWMFSFSMSPTITGH